MGIMIIMNFITPEGKSIQEDVILMPVNLKKELFPRPLEILKRHQEIGAYDTGDLYDFKPPRPEPIWDPKNPGLGYVDEKCDPYGCRVRVGYHPILKTLYPYFPELLEEVGEHEGAHLGQPGKNIILHIYYDPSDDKVKYGKMGEVGRGIIEGGVKVARDKKGGVKQTSYEESSEFAKELDGLFPLKIIHKLAYISQIKLLDKKRVDPFFNMYKLKMKDIPKELRDLLYTLNRPVIKDGIRSYATRSKAKEYII